MRLILDQFYVGSLSHIGPIRSRRAEVGLWPFGRHQHSGTARKPDKMEPDVSFVGVKLLPGKLTKVGGITNPESSIWTIHITQFALAPGAISGKNIVSIVQDDGESFALGTLEKDRCDQFQVQPKCKNPLQGIGIHYLQELKFGL